MDHSPYVKPYVSTVTRGSICQARKWKPACVCGWEGIAYLNKDRALREAMTHARGATVGP